MSMLPAISACTREEITQRDYNINQIKELDGTDKKSLVYAIKGTVFNVTEDKELFTTCSSENTITCLDDVEKINFSLDDISDSLKQLIDEKYQHLIDNCYPILGKLSKPANELKLTKEELIYYNGEQINIPFGRINPPIYIAVKKIIFDVSYGGFHNYGPEGNYHLFAGHDASRSLALLSVEPIDLENPDISDLTDEQLNIVEDWIQQYKVKYPIIGTLIV